MEAYKKYTQKRYGPARNDEICAVSADRVSIDAFAQAFCAFFDRAYRNERNNENSSRVMRQLVAEMPSVLQTVNGNRGKWPGKPGPEGKNNSLKEPDLYKFSVILSENCDISREEALAILMPAWCKFMLRSHADRLAEFAKEVWDVTGEDVSVSTIAQEGIARFQDFICQCGLAVTLREYGVRNIDSRRMAEQTIKNYGQDGIKFCPGDIQSIYELAKG